MRYSGLVTRTPDGWFILLPYDLAKDARMYDCQEIEIDLAAGGVMQMKLMERVEGN